MSGPEESEEDKASWEDWEEEEERFVSLVDGQEFASAEEAIAHDRSTHQVDLAHPSLDSYARMRLINFIRSQPEPWSGGMPEAELYADDRYYAPVLEGDALLSWAPEHELQEEDEVEALEPDDEMLEGLDFERIKETLRFYSLRLVCGRRLIW